MLQVFPLTDPIVFVCPLRRFAHCSLPERMTGIFVLEHARQGRRGGR